MTETKTNIIFSLLLPFDSNEIKADKSVKIPHLDTCLITGDECKIKLAIENWYSRICDFA